MKTRKLFIGVLSFFCTLGLAGCGEESPSRSSGLGSQSDSSSGGASSTSSGGSSSSTDEHEHVFSTSWSYDETNHWKEATCGHAVKKDFGTHAFDNGVDGESDTTYTCEVCGYAKEEKVPYRVNEGRWKGIFNDLTNYTAVISTDTSGFYAIRADLPNGLGQWILSEISPEGEWWHSSLFTSTDDKYLKYNYSQAANNEGSWSYEEITEDDYNGGLSLANIYIDAVLNNYFAFGFDKSSNSYKASRISLDEPANEGLEDKLCMSDVEIAFFDGKLMNFSFDLSKVGSESKSVKFVNIGTTTIKIQTPAHKHTFVDEICNVCGDYSNEPGFVFVKNDQESSYSIKGMSGKERREIVIPRKWKGLPVTGILNFAFHGHDELQAVLIPDSVTSIGFKPFVGCSSLESIAVEEGNPIYRSAGNCLIEKASKTLLAGCKGSVIPADGSVASIGYGAFSGCTFLASISIPDCITSIEGDAFSGCTFLASIEIPNSVERIGDYAFAGCSALASIGIPDSVKFIDQYAFSSCSALLSFSIPNSITSIESGTFYECIALTSIDIPSSVTDIGQLAFSGCSALASIEIPNSVERIGYCAFADCSALASIGIPDSVTSIEFEPFVGCSSLESITVGEGNPIYRSAGDCLIEKASKTLLAGCKNSVIPADGSVAIIGGDAFSGRTSLSSISIPDCITSIEGDAFSGCASLASIDIPSSVASIGSGAFSGCASLASIDIPSSVASIGSGAFSGCSALSSVSIPSSIALIDYGTFSGCISLISFDIPDSVEFIGGYAFSGCSALASVEIPNSVERIDDYAFAGCSALTSVEMPNSVKLIGVYAFSGCTSLVSVIIPKSVLYIGFGTFAETENLGRVYFGGSEGDLRSAFHDDDFDSSILYCYSENEPTEEGRYWHYVDGVVTEW